jgi:hypothetical protein
VTQAASQGLSQNEIGCARISMMARSTNAPCKGRIQMRKTNPLHLFKSGLQRTAGPYSWVKTGKARSEQMFSVLHPITDLGTAERIVAVRPLTAAPPLDLKGQFKFEFNNYLRSALTLRGVSSHSPELHPCHVHVDPRPIHTPSIDDHAAVRLNEMIHHPRSALMTQTNAKFTRLLA